MLITAQKDIIKYLTSKCLSNTTEKLNEEKQMIFCLKLDINLPYIIYFNVRKLPRKLKSKISYNVNKRWNLHLLILPQQYLICPNCYYFIIIKNNLALLTISSIKGIIIRPEIKGHSINRLRQKKKQKELEYIYVVGHR